MNYISKIELDGSTAPIGSSLFGVCDTAANESLKVVDIPEFDEPSIGTTIFVKFTNGNTRTNMYLSVGEDRSKQVIDTGVSVIPPNTVVSFTYVEGTNTGLWYKNESQMYPTVVVKTDGSDANKKGYCSFNNDNVEQHLNRDRFFIVTLIHSNTAEEALTLSINNQEPKPIYIDNELSSDSNYSLTAGTYIVYYDGSNDRYYFSCGDIPKLENKYVNKTGDTMRGNLFVTSSTAATITAGDVDYAKAALLRARNYNGWVQLYAGTTTNEVGLSIAVMNDPLDEETDLPSAQSVLYRKNEDRSPTMLGTYKMNGSFRNYCIGSDAISGRRWQIIPTVENNGRMEIGKIVDFHRNNPEDDSKDYTFRINNTQDGKLSLSGTVNQGSSRKIKENIEDISLDEAKNILNLRPVRFDYITGSKDERGFIAEEVAEIYPNLVVPENEEFQIPASLNYIGIIPYLVKVIQDQEKRLNEQEKRIKELEK